VAEVAGHDLLPPVSVEVEELGARHDGHGHRAGRAEEPPLEAVRFRGGPGLGKRQRLRCPGLEVGDEGLEVQRRESTLGPGRQADAQQAEARHSLQALLPDGTRHVPR
jgi:hypothetical protein